MSPEASPSSTILDEPVAILNDLAYLCTVMVNVVLVGPPGAGDPHWVLVDSGLTGSAGRIARAAANRFGDGARPVAIVLTHGHFDHVGGLPDLADRWDAPIYAHRLELPYLTGTSAYPPPDPTVGGGVLASLSWMYPKRPIDLGSRVHPLPDDGTIPGLPEWRWIVTPGHAPGHVSLFRERDRSLIAGDAFVTTKQESLLAVMTQSLEIHGPPRYFTPDWVQAGQSVRELAGMQPETAVTGHGVPMQGEGLRSGLDRLARNFETLAVPDHGRYVGRPAVTDENGVVSVPPDVAHPGRMLAAMASGMLAGAWLGGLFRQKRHF